MEPTSDERAPEVTPANPEPALLSDTRPADPSQENGVEAPRSEEEAARPGYGEFKLPEGVTADADSLKPATELFAETGLSQDQAQKFIDLAMARETAAAHKRSEERRVGKECR